MKFNFDKKFKNSAWILSEKIVSIFGLIFVTSFVAKYIGPVKFGLLSLSLLTFQFVQTLASVGCDLLIIKRVSQNTKSGLKVIFSYLVIVPVIYVLISILVFIYLFIDGNHDATMVVFFFAACVACFFSALDLISYYNEATLNAKFNAISNVTGLVLSLAIRFFITYLHLDFRLLAIPIISVTAIPFCIRYFNFLYVEKNRFQVKKTKHVKKYIIYSIRAGLGVLFSAISVAIYTRINQASVAFFLGLKDSGLYSVSMTLSTAWVFIPNALLMSFFPSFFAERNMNDSIEKFKKLYLMVIIISLFIIINIFIFSGVFIKCFYGEAFEGALSSVYILSFASMFAILSGVADRFTVKYGGNKYIAYKSFSVLLFCLLSSSLLVPLYGIIGASFSVLLTEVFSATIANYLFKNGVHLKMQVSMSNPVAIYSLIKNIRNY